MNKVFAFTFVTFTAFFGAAASCGDDRDEGSPGAGDRAGAAGGAGTAGGGGAGAAGTGSTCGGFVRDAADPCQRCVQQSCCDAAATCLAAGACSVCDDDPYGEGCQLNTDSRAFRKCRLNNCAEACKIRDAKVDVDAPAQTSDTSCGDEGFGCNPVKVEKCAGGNAEFCDPAAKVGVCDENGQVERPDTLGYQCYCPPHKRTIGQSCGADAGFCVEGLDCYNWTDTCAKYCCADADCSPGARCAKEPGALWGKGKVGVCLQRDAF